MPKTVARPDFASGPGPVQRAVDAVLRVIISVIFAILVVCVVWQVVSRYVFGTPSTLTDELARFLFMWLALIGAAYTLGLKRHLAIDLLPLSLEGTAERNLRLVIVGMVAAFAGLVMVYGGGKLLLGVLQTGQLSPVLRIQMGYVYGAIPFAGLVMLFYCALSVRDILSGRDVAPAMGD
ncbi:TRAP transporter small permease [Nitratireductor sp. CH_MIT9313-5]|uniref:TRAP transporter small permease n=1 Tax=Nitratireductor sp. CH_MIT9313-5 TaxID=3107764 RepID=UPI0030089C43